MPALARLAVAGLAVCLAMGAGQPQSSVAELRTTIPADAPVLLDAPGSGLEPARVVAMAADVPTAAGALALTPATTPTMYLPQPATSSSSPIPKPQPTLRSVFGVDVIQLREYRLAKSAGALWARRAGIWWPDVEPVEGQRNWRALRKLEAEFRYAAALGLQLIVVVRGTPEWAQAKGSACGPIKPDKLGAFAQFAGDLVKRYSVAPYKVKYWEMWNEPDIATGLVPPDSTWGCWGDATDADYGGAWFAGMLKAAYPEMKAADPEAQVLVGGLLLDCDPRNPPAGKDCKPARFLEGILKYGGGDAFDGVAFHAYDYYSGARGQYSNAGWASAWNTTGPVVSAKAAYLRQILDRYGYAHRYLVATEVALICGQTGGEAECKTKDFSDTKSAYIAEAYAASMASRVKAAIWYSLSGWRASGLVSGRLQPLNAYLAYRTAARRMVGTVSVKLIEPEPGLKAYEFTRNGGRMWLVWSTDSAGQPLPASAPPSAAYDVYGTRLSRSKPILVTSIPVYVEWRD